MPESLLGLATRCNSLPSPGHISFWSRFPNVISFSLIGSAKLCVHRSCEDDLNALLRSYLIFPPMSHGLPCLINVRFKFRVIFKLDF